MFAGIDLASERHTLARLDATGAPIGKPVPITKDREGYDAWLQALGLPPDDEARQIVLGICDTVAAHRRGLPGAVCLWSSI